MNNITDDNPLIFNVCPKEISVTAKDIGAQLACDYADKQAAMLAWWADEVGKYGPTESWPQQCRMIAEAMTEEECRAVASILDTLVEHLHAIPSERLIANARAVISKPLVAE